jgi:hypothetical protein
MRRRQRLISPVDGQRDGCPFPSSHHPAACCYLNRRFIMRTVLPLTTPHRGMQRRSIPRHANRWRRLLDRALRKWRKRFAPRSQQPYGAT